jgi:hypothetical protein
MAILASSCRAPLDIEIGEHKVTKFRFYGFCDQKKSVSNPTNKKNNNRNILEYNRNKFLQGRMEISGPTNVRKGVHVEFDQDTGTFKVSAHKVTSFARCPFRIFIYVHFISVSGCANRMGSLCSQFHNSGLTKHSHRVAPWQC